MYTKNTPSQKNQEQQALEQIRAIIETLGAGQLHCISAAEHL